MLTPFLYYAQHTLANSSVLSSSLALCSVALTNESTLFTLYFNTKLFAFMHVYLCWNNKIF